MFSQQKCVSLYSLQLVPAARASAVGPFEPLRHEVLRIQSHVCILLLAKLSKLGWLLGWLPKLTA